MRRRGLRFYGEIEGVLITPTNDSDEAAAPVSEYHDSLPDLWDTSAVSHMIEALTMLGSQQISQT